ncbi:hypothetical protein BCR34DRAFT_358135 [Clohesyomyces aquaticus]|uniref:Uncharacterized protein n=1 Tax=Clohesyomyces aquaticus TaxID=1231657 RepID=A0A1Y1ZJ80_9PLEO|nr:hypothetical protein BCR34DRAFT_358135 [Clohesyomyces aquaticus]
MDRGRNQTHEKKRVDREGNSMPAQGFEREPARPMLPEFPSLQQAASHAGDPNQSNGGLAPRHPNFPHVATYANAQYQRPNRSSADAPPPYFSNLHADAHYLSNEHASTPYNGNQHHGTPFPSTRHDRSTFHGIHVGPLRQRSEVGFAQATLRGADADQYRSSVSSNWNHDLYTAPAPSFRASQSGYNNATVHNTLMLYPENSSGARPFSPSPRSTFFDSAASHPTPTSRSAVSPSRRSVSHDAGPYSFARPPLLDISSPFTCMPPTSRVDVLLNPITAQAAAAPAWKPQRSRARAAKSTSEIIIAEDTTATPKNADLGKRKLEEMVEESPASATAPRNGGHKPFEIKQVGTWSKLPLELKHRILADYLKLDVTITAGNVKQLTEDHLMPLLGVSVGMAREALQYFYEHNNIRLQPLPAEGFQPATRFGDPPKLEIHFTYPNLVTNMYVKRIEFYGCPTFIQKPEEDSDEGHIQHSVIGYNYGEWWRKRHGDNWHYLKQVAGGKYDFLKLKEIAVFFVPEPSRMQSLLWKWNVKINLGNGGEVLITDETKDWEEEMKNAIKSMRSSGRVYREPRWSGDHYLEPYFVLVKREDATVPLNAYEADLNAIDLAKAPEISPDDIEEWFNETSEEETLEEESSDRGTDD